MGKNHLLSLMCSDCGILVDDPTDLYGGRCHECAGAEDKLGGRDRRGDAGLARGMNTEGVVLSEWERSPQGRAISAMRRDVISGARSVRSDAIALKSLFGTRYGMLMPAGEYKASVKERSELTAVVNTLTDYLSYAEGGNDGE